MTAAPADVVEIEPGAFALRTSHVEGWAGLVRGTHRTLAVDAGKDGAEGLALVARMTAIGGAPDLLAYTHGHWDHVRGGLAFDTPEIIAHRDAVPTVVAQLAEERALAPRPDGVALSGEPTLSIADAVELGLGGVEVVLLPTPGHAPGAVSVYLPTGRVLFAGDTVVTAIPPALGDGDSVALQATLETLLTMHLEAIVPGHGPMLRGRHAVDDHLHWSIAYLEGVRRRVDELRATRSLDDIVVAAAFEAHIGSRLPADRYRMRWRHEIVVRRIHAELHGASS